MLSPYSFSVIKYLPHVLKYHIRVDCSQWRHNVTVIYEILNTAHTCLFYHPTLQLEDSRSVVRMIRSVTGWVFCKLECQ